MTEYKKTLDYYDLFFASLGHILGAGIYSVIGKLGYYTGYHSYISIILASIIIFWFAKSYININDKYESNDSEYLSIKDTFGEKKADILIYGAVIGNIFACVVIAISFGGYLSKLLNISPQIGIVLCILLCGSISILGIRQTADFNNMMTLLESSGLLTVICFGLYYVLQKVTFKDIKKNLAGIFTDSNLFNIFFGTYLIFFAFFGFESLVKFSEESENSKRDIPLSINHSISIASIIYLLISITSLNILTPAQLGSSIAPLTDVLKALPNSYYLSKYLSITAVGSTLNTFLIILTGDVRLLVSLIKKYKSDNPRIQRAYNLLKKIDPVTQTPINCCLFLIIVIILFILFRINFTLSTSISTFGLLLTIISVKLSDIL